MRNLVKPSLIAMLVAVGLNTSASAEPLSDGIAAYQRGDYVRAVRKLEPLAARGNPKAQAMLGFMYEHGLGAPQAYVVAADLYGHAAEQGDPTGQYLLGLLYDKGHGVPEDVVLAYKWLNLAAARAPKREREYVLRLRYAVASKMTSAQIAEGQWLAVNWTPKY